MLRDREGEGGSCQNKRTGSGNSAVHETGRNIVVVDWPSESMNGKCETGNFTVRDSGRLRMFTMDTSLFCIAHGIQLKHGRKFGEDVKNPTG